MFDVSYRRSFIFLVITISNVLSVVSRLYISYKLINFELDGNQACLVVNVLIRLGRARLGAGDHAAPRWVRLSSLLALLGTGCFCSMGSCCSPPVTENPCPKRQQPGWKGPVRRGEKTRSMKERPTAPLLLVCVLLACAPCQPCPRLRSHVAAAGSSDTGISGECRCLRRGMLHFTWHFNIFQQ